MLLISKFNYYPKRTISIHDTSHMDINKKLNKVKLNNLIENGRLV